MNTYVVWIEMDKAKIFKIKTEGQTIKILRRHQFRHHLGSEPEKHKDCELHHHPGLGDKVVGMLTLDIQSNPRLLAHSRKFFTNYDLYENPITA